VQTGAVPGRAGAEQDVVAAAGRRAGECRHRVVLSVAVVSRARALEEPRVRRGRTKPQGTRSPVHAAPAVLVLRKVDGEC